jgi:methylated-DNA-[protein]-cysteine S-methyltransferase
MKSFKERVLEIVAKIPEGKTLLYKEVASRAGNEKAARAVGKILNTHQIKGLPCHRVVSSGGIGGYRYGLRKKQLLLKKEGVVFE